MEIDTPTAFADDVIAAATAAELAQRVDLIRQLAEHPGINRLPIHSQLAECRKLHERAGRLPGNGGPAVSAAMVQRPRRKAHLATAVGAEWWTVCDLVLQAEGTTATPLEDAVGTIDRAGGRRVPRTATG
jgi:hypothetical protein